MVLLLEDLVETVLINYGLTSVLAIGSTRPLDFITDTLNIPMKNMERILVKCASEYSRYKPKERTVVLNGNTTGSGLIVQLPDDFIAFKQAYYGFLNDLPRTLFDPYSYKGVEWYADTRTLKVFPPITSVKVVYTGGLAVTKNIQITQEIETVEDEDVIEDILQGSPRNCTLKFTKNGKEMVITDTSEDGSTATLDGTLGTGTLNLYTREFSIDLDDTSAGTILITYYPTYKTITALDMQIGDIFFYDLFSYNILLPISNALKLSTQEVLHNIDVSSTLQLDATVQLLGEEVRKKLRSGRSMSGLNDV